jgi:hypothetical protein
MCRRWIVALVLGSVLLTMAGCGGSSPSSAGGGALAGIPRYPGSTAFGSPTVTGSITTQSFQVTSGSPAKILQWYGTHLHGWTPITDAGPSGATDRTGRWQRGSRRLQVSSAPADAAGSTQYSLVVAADGAPLP